MALVLKMQIDDKQEHQYIFSTGDEGTIELIPLSVVANGRYQAPEGKAYNLVSVEVPEIELESLNITQSGTYTAPSGKAYDVVTVDIPEYILDALTATENGTFEPASGHVYNRVVVNVPSEEPEIQTKSVTYTANGTYTVNKDAGFDGMSSVTVTVSVPGPNLQFKRLTYKQNGTATVTPDSGYDGLEEVEVNIDVPAPVPSLQTKPVTVTANGSSVITADSGFDGLEEVDLTVNVPTGGGGSSDIIAGTVTVKDTSGTGAKECWTPVVIPAGKSIAGILIRSKTLQVYTAPSAWYRAMVHWGMIPQNQYADKENAKCRIVAYYNSASATSLQPGFTTTGIPIASTLGTGLNDVAAFDSSKGLGLKVKATQGGNAYGFALNTDYEYIIMLVDA